MARRVVITGLGVISPFGDSPAALTEALEGGLSALHPVEQFPTDGKTCRHAGELRDFAPKTYLAGNLRPLDRLSRMVASAAKLALESGGLPEGTGEQRELGLVLGTMYSSVQVIAAFDRRGVEAGPAYSKPMQFANSVLNSAAGQTAIWHKLRGINSTVCTGSASGVSALAYAADLIAGGRMDVLLAGGAEGLCHEVFHGYHQAGSLCRSDGDEAVRPVPYDAERNGFALGEGAALFLLEDADSAAAREAGILGEILGAGAGFDAGRGREEEPAVAAGVRSIRAALESAGLAPDAIDAVSASANGSVQLDRLEARTLAEAFGEHAATLPVTAVKSMLGESLGAAGAFQAAALLGGLSSGRLPGIRGLERTDADAAPLGLLRETTSLTMQRGLVHSTRLDGGAASLVLGR